MGIKWLDQLYRDKGRSAYRVIFPATTDAQQIETFLHSIAGTLTDQLYGLLGTYTLGIEVRASSTGIEHTIMIPWQREEVIINLMRSTIPGIELTPTPRPLPLWTQIIEFSEKSAEHTFDVADPARLSTSLLQVLGSLDGDEHLMIQWVIASQTPQRKPQDGNDKDSLHDQRAKLVSRNVRGVLRVCSRSDTESHARDLIARVRHVYDSSATAHNKFKVRAMLNRRDLQERVDSAFFPLLPGFHLTLSELTGMLALPLGDPKVPGLPTSSGRSIAAHETVARGGRVLGHSDYPGRSIRPVAIPFEAGLRHTWLLGASGMGKTTAMGDYFVQDISAGHGAVLIEASGDLYSIVTNRIPRARQHDVVLFDVIDSQFPVGFNILRFGSPDTAVESISNLFDRMSDSSSLFNRRVMYHALKTLLLDEHATFPDIEALISPMAHQVDWHETMKKKADADPVLRGFWQDYDAMGKQKAQAFVQPTLNRIWELLSRDAVKNIIGQPTSSFSIDDIIAGNKILLVNLSGLPPETSKIMGALIVEEVNRSIRRVRAPLPNFLYMDEVHNYVGTSSDPRVMFSEARKFNLGLVVAHQYMKQLSPALTAAIQANTSTKIVFRTEAEDGKTVERQFAGTITADDIISLKKHHAVVRLEGSDGSMSSVTITAPAPSRTLNSAGWIVDRNRHLYGRPVHEVEHSFRTRYEVERPARRKAPTPDVGWETIG